MALKKGAIKNLQKKRKSEIVWMSDKWIYNEIHPLYIKQIEILVGILIGTFLSLVNLQSTA